MASACDHIHMIIRGEIGGKPHTKIECVKCGDPRWYSINDVHVHVYDREPDGTISCVAWNGGLCGHRRVLP